MKGKERLKKVRGMDRQMEQLRDSIESKKLNKEKREIETSRIGEREKQRDRI